MSVTSYALPSLTWVKITASFIVSVTEGEDKPLKYPNMFQSAQVCIINKTDLLPYVEIDLVQMKKYASTVNPALAFIELSAKTGGGI